MNKLLRYSLICFVFFLVVIGLLIGTKKWEAQDSEASENKKTTKLKKMKDRFKYLTARFSNKKRLKTYIDPYENAEVIDHEESTPDERGRFTRVQVVRINFKYPLLRVEERLKWDANAQTENLITRIEAVSDHALVLLKPGRSLQELTDSLKEEGMEVLKVMPYSGAVVVGFSGERVHALDEALVTLQSMDVIRRSEPDIIVHPN